ncbi:hypothetical protein AVEN_137454-1 [Araneus ventricosus]|uniref:Uncharacterized protein n=1 Tax=Araneus ventricosus TaxID=182803 RepID=A0A4Y2VLN0_ARAVE|nr:hypothetical protein AVEN_137454-1 [Araneus ventricosus]
MTRTTPEWAPPSPGFPATPTGGRLATVYDLAPCTADLQWNRVSNLRPSGHGIETLPLGRRGLQRTPEMRSYDSLPDTPFRCKIVQRW